MFKRSLVFCALLVLVAAAQPALASCSGLCEHTPQPGKPFCRTCVDAGYETGAGCRQSGQCGCFYVQCAAFSTVATAVGVVPVPDLDCQAAKLAPADLALTQSIDLTLN